MRKIQHRVQGRRWVDIVRPSVAVDTESAFHDLIICFNEHYTSQTSETVFASCDSRVVAGHTVRGRQRRQSLKNQTQVEGLLVLSGIRVQAANPYEADPRIH